MAKIHWVVYLASGLLLASVSWKIDFQRFRFFFYVGLLFILIAAIKMIFSFGSKEAKRQKTHKDYMQSMQQDIRNGTQYHARHVQPGRLIR